MSKCFKLTFNNNLKECRVGCRIVQYTSLLLVSSLQVPKFPPPLSFEHLILLFLCHWFLKRLQKFQCCHQASHVHHAVLLDTQILRLGKQAQEWKLRIAILQNKNTRLNITAYRNGAWKKKLFKCWWCTYINWNIWIGKSTANAQK